MCLRKRGREDLGIKVEGAGLAVKVTDLCFVVNWSLVFGLGILGIWGLRVRPRVLDLVC